MYKNLLFILILFLASCTNKPVETIDVADSTDVEELCTDPVCRILIQPYDDFPAEWSELAANELLQYICDNSWITVTDVQVLPAVSLDDSLLNDSKSRYRANKILDAQLKAKEEYTDVVVGLTEKDISTSVHGRKDWGILGLAYLRKSVCVVSTYRISNVERDLGKVVFHEFNHAFMGHPHCPDDNPTCIMKDCKGKADFTHKTELCSTCKKLM
jgi:archaemetzincin